MTALAVVCLCSLSVGARARAAEWTRAVTTHFEVLTTAGGGTAADVGDYLESIQSFFEAFLSLPAPSGTRTQVIVFANRREYAPYRTTASAAAYYQPSRDRDFIVLGEFTGDSEPTLVHEYAHAALERAGAVYPPWLSEGLAEFFSTVTPEKDRMVLGRPPIGRLATLAQGEFLPLARVLSVTRGSPEYTSLHAGVFYAESWALVHMLVAGERYQPHVDRFLRSVATSVPVADAIRDAFGRTVDELERDLRQYLARGYYRQLSAPFRPRTGDARPNVTPLDRFDAELALATMLAAGPGRQAAARDAFERLSRERPEDGALAAARGRFELLDGDEAAARAWFDRAVSARTTDAMAWADLARLLESSDRARAGALLDTAVALAPDNVTVRLRLAAHLVQERRAADALSALARLSPTRREDRFLFYQVQANAYALTSDFDDARHAARMVAPLASTPAEIAFAEQLLRQVSGPPGVSRTIDGRLRQVDCAGPMMVLEVVTVNGTVRLALDDPKRIAVGGGGTVDINCGPQDATLRVGFDDSAPPAGTAGRIRILDFRTRR